ncbi:hypothetical protein JIG36_15815 [Actinoplanes sp. LDG1-06]|uniref:Uncharacterized protein n=1 Tax=Paractinoplanes ovalisporus TaxID=2810368 RepID=A0ABS2AB31_9ACTN|nr:hypothetical protein [Actinoplanes ovalisporus]MBM2617024.1 hypothetical protein [Actinoplanes ovalisporus]
MEENSPPERRKTTRARTPRAPFTGPGESPPGETSPRRPRKAAPPVTFQPPGAENHPEGGPAAAETPGRPRSADPAGVTQPASPDASEPAPARAQRPRKATPGAPAKKATPPEKRAPAKRVAAAAQKAPAAKKAAPAKKVAPVKKPPVNAPAPAPEVEVEVVEASLAPAGETPVAVEPAAEVSGATAVEVSATHAPPVGRAEVDRWAKLLADPVHTPELLARAAVETIGPRAREWASATRAAYPAATPDALARLASRQFTRFGAVASVFGALAGSYASIALVATRTLTDAELVLHLAAAYGLDPTDPRRAVDLLVITQVHETAAEAEEALAATQGPEPTASGLGDAMWRVGRMFVSRTGSWTALRMINRYYPGFSLIGAVLTSAADAQMTAARAITYYRGATAA